MRYLALLWCAGAAFASGVQVRFDPTAPDIGPFPTDFLTVTDPDQKTGLRVRLPMPDCSAQPSTCGEIAEINQLDGFNVNPRIRVSFSGDINPYTLTDGLFFVALENLTGEEYGLKHFGDLSTINQPVWDPATKTAFAKPDDFLDQHRRFVIVVTDSILDASGDRVEADPNFQGCIVWQPNDYCRQLAQAVAVAAPKVAPRQIISASVFTTQSATAWLEQARRALEAAPTGFKRTGDHNVFQIADLTSIAFNEQTGTDTFAKNEFPMFIYAGVGRVAFGSYLSPDFLNNQRMIQPTPTGAAVPLPESTNEVFFHAWLPPTPMPPGGYPVVIFGHGFGANRFYSPELVASSLAQAGFATVAINAVGHGGGPKGVLQLTDRAGKVTEMPGGGRSLDLNHDGVYDPVEGCLLLSPTPISVRDCLRQTALDIMQLVRVIQAGADMDGDGKPDLNPDRLYYAGQSLGAIYGTIVNAVEPALRAAVLNSGGGSFVDIARSSPVYRPLAAAVLGMRQPSLLNAGNGFIENIPLRYRWTLINDTPGAIEIQEWVERLEWIQASGDPLSYAPHLWSSTLPGVPIKRVFFSYGIGDRSVPNPQQTALVRAANLRQTTRIYRHDLARKLAPDLPENPHTYLLNLAPPATLIALAAQAQMAGFFASDGLLIPEAPEPLKALFETPDFLTEDYNY